MTGFFEELKRRKVYRAAVAYVVAAGGLIQLASAVFPAWELPGWSLRLVVVILLIGFPLTLLLAWVLELTPEGIRTTPTLSNAPRRNRNVLALIAIGVIGSAAAGFFLLPGAAARKFDKSIAVLPFENLSQDKDSAYFADGVQDDILTSLAKIGDLKVISRTSVMPYRGKELNVREIGKALGVATVLEGSVRKAGNRVRVNVQLINAQNDEHIWAEDYDRDLTDVFAIQTDLAQKIAQELSAKLSPAETAQMTKRPTDNGEAYLALVQARNLHLQLEDIDKLKQAEQLYDRAIELDPNFALALARYSQLESWIYHTFEPTTAHKEKARALADRALGLQPTLPEAHLALGFSFYYGERDYESALKEFGIAQRDLPNDADVYLAIGAIQRRQGKWLESNANIEKATSLSPNDPWPLQNLTFNYQMLRDFPLANKTIDRALKLKPDSFSLWGIKAQLEIAEKGTFDTVARCAELVSGQPVPERDRAKFSLALAQTLLLQRKFAEAAAEAEKVSDDVIGRDLDGLSTKYELLGLGRRHSGNEAGARESFIVAKDYAERYLALAPDEAGRHAKYAIILAWLGEKEKAINEAKKAVELVPETLDAFEAPNMVQTLAEVYVVTGENEKAIDLLDGLLTRPGALTVQALKLVPIWDPLRNDPRFIEVLKRHGGT